MNLEDLKAEADVLGIKYSANIGAPKLSEKIEAYYESQETSGKELLEAVAQNEAKEKEQSEVSSAEINKSKMLRNRIDEKEEKARKTRVVTIIDNDQRVNNQTTTAKATCGNMYFDLGLVIVPLNMPVEMMQGHIDCLKACRIPLHGKDTTTGLSTVRMVPRYTISYEDVK